MRWDEASLCGHYEVAQMLLEQGALCERDTFQGERCLYNALNDRIRNLLLQYDYSKSTDPLQPLAAHVTSLLTRDTPKTADITVQAGEDIFELHKFVLSARSPYFAQKLAAAPETKFWKLTSSIAPRSFETCIRHLYMAEVGADLSSDSEAIATLAGIDKLSKQMEIPHLYEDLLSSGDRRQARQRRTEEVQRSRDQLADWFANTILKHKTIVATAKVEDVKWDSNNTIFADVLLRADEEEDEVEPEIEQPTTRKAEGPLNGIPIGPSSDTRSPSRTRKPRQSVLFPCHRAMLLRSEVFATMFASPFREGQESTHLQIVPVDCSPEVLEIILTFMYTEKADFSLSLALEVLNTADMLFIERLKQRAALLISTLGAGSTFSSSDPTIARANVDGRREEDDQLDIYEVIRSGWDTRVHRLEEFGARYIAYKLERYIDEAEFKDLVRESANRIQARQETDTVELIDDIRYYLSERFRLRFEDVCLPEESEDELEEGMEKLGVDDDEAEGQVVIRTLDGEIAGDEFAQDALNYQILLGKIDTLMETLGLDG